MSKIRIILILFLLDLVLETQGLKEAKSRQNANDIYCEHYEGCEASSGNCTQTENPCPENCQRAMKLLVNGDEKIKCQICSSGYSMIKSPEATSHLQGKCIENLINCSQTEISENGEFFCETCDFGYAYDESQRTCSKFPENCSQGSYDQEQQLVICTKCWEEYYYNEANNICDSVDEIIQDCLLLEPNKMACKICQKQFWLDEVSGLCLNTLEFCEVHQYNFDLQKVECIQCIQWSLKTPQKTCLKIPTFCISPWFNEEIEGVACKGCSNTHLLAKNHTCVKQLENCYITQFFGDELICEQCQPSYLLDHLDEKRCYAKIQNCIQSYYSQEFEYPRCLTCDQGFSLNVLNTQCYPTIPFCLEYNDQVNYDEQPICSQCEIGYNYQKGKCEYDPILNDLKFIIIQIIIIGLAGLALLLIWQKDQLQQFWKQIGNNENVNKQREIFEEEEEEQKENRQIRNNSQAPSFSLNNQNLNTQASQFPNNQQSNNHNNQQPVNNGTGAYSQNNQANPLHTEIQAISQIFQILANNQAAHQNAMRIEEEKLQQKKIIMDKFEQQFCGEIMSQLKKKIVIDKHLECPICLEQFLDQEKCVALPCKPKHHIYHQKCLNGLFYNGHYHCALCRQSKLSTNIIDFLLSDH